MPQQQQMSVVHDEASFHSFKKRLLIRLSALQVVTELVLGFPTHFATLQMLAKQQALFDTLHNGLVALPIDLPFTGTPLFL